MTTLPPLWYPGITPPLSDWQAFYQAGITQPNEFRPTVKDFGAKGDGATDDTAAFNAAIAALSGAGGVLFVPAGTYNISSTIDVAGPSVYIQGAGRATVILQTSANQGVFSVTGTDARIEHMMLGYSVTPGAGTVALSTSSVYGRYSHLTLYNVATGIHVTGEATCQFFQFITGLTASISCFWVDNTSDTQLSHFLFLPGGVDSAGANYAAAGAIRVTGWVEGFTAQSGEVFGGRYSLTMAGNSMARGDCPAFCNFDNVFFDSSSSYGLLITYALDTEFTNCWIACGRTPGAALPGAWLTSTSGFRFCSSKFIANGSHGLVLNAGVVNTTVLGCTFDSNGGQVAAGTVAGVAVQAGVSSFIITDSRFGNTIIAPPTGGVQQYGVVVSAGNSDHYRIEGNIFDSTLGGIGVLDAGTGTDKRVEIAIGNRGSMTFANNALLSWRGSDGQPHPMLGMSADSAFVRAGSDAAHVSLQGGNGIDALTAGEAGVNIPGALTAGSLTANTAFFPSNVGINGTVTAGGAVNVAGTMTTNALNAGGAVTCGTTLNVVGATTLGGPVGVPGAVTFANQVNVVHNGSSGTAAIRMVGDGSITPQKAIVVGQGQFQIMNDAGTVAVLILSDSGVLTTASSIQCGNNLDVVGFFSVQGPTSLNGKMTLGTGITINAPLGSMKTAANDAAAGTAGAALGDMYINSSTGAVTIRRT